MPRAPGGRSASSKGQPSTGPAASHNKEGTSKTSVIGDEFCLLPIPRLHSPRPPNDTERARIQTMDRLQYFLTTAPTQWSGPQAQQRASMVQFPLPNGENVSCVLWNGLYHISGTDIVRALAFRFEAFSRPVRRTRKWEEGVFSDLRNLKAGVDATLEGPKSPLLDFLFRKGCIRTQKKQKVFYWFSVPHDRLFLDALERDLKREKAGQEPTSVVVGEPASSFRYDPHRSLYEQFSRYILERNPVYTKSRLVPTLQSATDALDTHAESRALDLCHFDVQHGAQVYSAPLGQESIIISPSRDTMNTSRRHGIGHVIPMEPNVSVNSNSRLLGQRTSPVQAYEAEPAPSHEALSARATHSPVGSRIFDPYHHEEHPPSDQIFPLQAPGPSSSFGHVCPYDTCRRPFKRSEHLRRHIGSHTDERPYSCLICRRTFSRNDNLLQHSKIHCRRQGSEMSLESVTAHTESVSEGYLRGTSLSVLDRARAVSQYTPCAVSVLLPVVSLKDTVSSVPLLTGASNYLPWAETLQFALSGVRGCLCLLDETPVSYLPSKSTPTPYTTSLPAAVWKHLDTALAHAIVRSLSPDLAALFQSIVLGHPCCAAGTLWLKLEADYGGRSSYDLWQAVQALTPQPQGSTPVTEFMTARKNKFKAIKAAGYTFDRWFLDTLVADLGPHLGPTVRSLDFSTLTYDSLYAAVRGVDDSHRLHAALPSSSMALAASVTPIVPSAAYPCDICQSPDHWSPTCPERKAPDALARKEASRRARAQRAKVPGQIVKVIEYSRLPALASIVRGLLSAPRPFDSALSMAPSSAPWIYDTGAGAHMTGDASWVQGVRSPASPMAVQAANQACLPVSGAGEGLFPQSSWRPGRYRQCPCGSWAWTLEDGTGVIGPPSNPELLRVQLVANSWDLEVTRSPAPALPALIASTGPPGRRPAAAPLAVWHRRLGHLAMAAVKSTHSRLSVGASLSPGPEPGLCEGCVMGKSSVSPFPSSQSRADTPLALVHTDICEMGVASAAGEKYLLVLADDHTRWTWGYVSKKKSDALACFQEWLPFVERQHAHRARVIRSDNGGEFISGAFEGFLSGLGVRHETTVPYSSQQNGIAERANRTIVERGISLLSAAHLPTTLRPAIMSTVVYLKNRSPSRSISTTPFQMLFGTPPNLSHLCVIGCVGWVHVHKKKRLHKLAPRAYRCVLLGYSTTQKTYRLWDPAKKEVVVARSVVFDEGVMGMAPGSADGLLDDLAPAPFRAPVSVGHGGEDAAVWDRGDDAVSIVDDSVVEDDDAPLPPIMDGFEDDAEDRSEAGSEAEAKAEEDEAAEEDEGGEAIAAGEDVDAVSVADARSVVEDDDASSDDLPYYPGYVYEPVVPAPPPSPPPRHLSFARVKIALLPF
ncbi:hypothetical protein L202_06520 [Cryptococcus amylolentus CBS 6039]|uniref:Uncharacterized protein n=1 Tax=Cryptococcus amylolentus CBS 6039 TaxID=1295533 RepID=A0A1E3HG97_9TREE|nr:hypothetical protein L202_06520 [Cryptococcus amylolentus CBS 6039]ODN75344.1 hypothetical protein L202_06520 [Cryptococcus amylolentus CBS 6039]